MMWSFSAMSSARDPWQTALNREHGRAIQSHVGSQAPPVAQVAPVIASQLASSSMHHSQGPRVAVVAPEPSRSSSTAMGKHLESDRWTLTDTCDDPYSLKRWTTEDANARASTLKRSYSAFRFVQNTSPARHTVPAIADGIETTASISGGSHVILRSLWSPQQSEDPLRGFRASIQNGELSKFTDSALTGHIGQMCLYPQSGHNSGENSNVNTDTINDSISSDSTDSLDFSATPQTTWSAVVQKNPRPMKQQNNRGPRPSKAINITLAACCATPKLKVTCSCCNEESLVKVKEELRPRVIPVATSQLGFCRFCQSNGDPAEVYQGHSLRSDDGKVTCPVLREYNCPICNNGGGDFAHTIKYCPLARKTKPNH